jgi:riboflavin synthase
MFTGLVEAVGTVRSVASSGAGARLEVGVAWPDATPPSRGDSIAVDGACLTAVAPSEVGFAADLSPETLARTTLGQLRAGERVNLERALRLGDRVGGHLVMGHVDAVVRLLAIEGSGRFARWRLSLPSELEPEVAPKGSVTLHGVSLTVAAVSSHGFEVALIPETLAVTVLARARVGARLNLETDVLAKYVVRASGTPRRSSLEELFGGEAGHA